MTDAAFQRIEGLQATRRPVNWFVPLGVAASAVAADALALTGMNSLVRVVVVCWFLLFCPGLAWTRVFDIHGAAATWMLALAVSTSLDIALALAALYAGFWSPIQFLVIMSALTLAVLGLDAVVRYYGLGRGARSK